MEALGIVADEKTAYRKPAIRSASDHGEHVNDGEMPQETIRGVIENVAYRVFGAAHDAFHAINRAQVVAAVDALAASGPHENVFVVIRHADDFVGHDLADG